MYVSLEWACSLRVSLASVEHPPLEDVSLVWASCIGASSGASGSPPPKGFRVQGEASVAKPAAWAASDRLTPPPTVVDGPETFDG